MKKLLLTTIFLVGNLGLAEAQTLSYPPPLSGMGTMSITASTTVSAANVTVTGTGAFPGGRLPNGYLRIRVQAGSTNGAAVCWTGGVCTYATGENLAVGEVVTKELTTFVANPPTVISKTGTALLEVEW